MLIGTSASLKNAILFQRESDARSKKARPTSAARLLQQVQKAHGDSRQPSGLEQSDIKIRSVCNRRRRLMAVIRQTSGLEQSDTNDDGRSTKRESGHSAGRRAGTPGTRSANLGR